MVAESVTSVIVSASRKSAPEKKAFLALVIVRAFNGVLEVPIAPLILTSLEVPALTISEPGPSNTCCEAARESLTTILPPVADNKVVSMESTLLPRCQSP